MRNKATPKQINDIGRDIINAAKAKNSGIVTFIKEDAIYRPFKVPIIGQSPSEPLTTSDNKNSQSSDQFTVYFGNDPSKVMGEWSFKDADFK